MRGWDVDRVLLLLAVLMHVRRARARPAVEQPRASRRWSPTARSTRSWPCRSRRCRTCWCGGIDTVNLGDVAFGLVLFAVAGAPDARSARWSTSPAPLASAVLLTGFLVADRVARLLHRPGRERGDLGLHAVLLLASYPADVFAGATKVLLYTAVPAAFVSGVPARLVDDFDSATRPCCSASPGSSPSSAGGRSRPGCAATRPARPGAAADLRRWGMITPAWSMHPDRGEFGAVRGRLPRSGPRRRRLTGAARRA